MHCIQRMSSPPPLVYLFPKWKEGADGEGGRERKGEREKRRERERGRERQGEIDRERERERERGLEREREVAGTSLFPTGRGYPPCTAG